jgi:hypothetical protein
LLKGAKGWQHNKISPRLQHFSHTWANKIKRKEMGRACKKHGRGHGYKYLVGKPERNTRRLLGRPTCRWDDIKMDFIEIRRIGVE